MNYEQFKENYESCERGLPYTREFEAILKELSTSFNGGSFHSPSGNLIVGLGIMAPRFAYFSEGRALYIKREVFQTLLSDFPNDDKCDIIAYCFFKYWMLDYDEKTLIIPEALSSIQHLLSCDKDGFEKNEMYVNKETGEVFSLGELAIEVESIPKVFDFNLQHSNQINNQ